MKNIKINLSVLALTTSLYATDTSLELSYIQTDGNTESISYTAIGKTKYAMANKSWIDGKIDTLYSETNSKKSANKFEIDLKYNRFINEKLFYYLGVNYKDDQFSGYNYRLNIGPGLGYKAMKNDTQELNTRVGLAYAKDKLNSGKTENYGASNIEAIYTHKITDSTDFSQELKYSRSLEDAENYTCGSTTALKVKMSDRLSLGTSYKVNYTNLTVAKKTDTKFLTSLIVNF